MYYDHGLHIVLSRPHLSPYVISTSYDIKEPRVEVIAILNSRFHLLVVRLYYIPLSLINTDIINIGFQLWSVCSLFFISPPPFPSLTQHTQPNPFSCLGKGILLTSHFAFWRWCNWSVDRIKIRASSIISYSLPQSPQSLALSGDSIGRYRDLFCSNLFSVSIFRCVFESDSNIILVAVIYMCYGTWM